MDQDFNTTYHPVYVPPAPAEAEGMIRLGEWKQLGNCEFEILVEKRTKQGSYYARIRSLTKARNLV